MMRQSIGVLVVALVASAGVSAWQRGPAGNPEVFLASLNLDVMPITGGEAENISHNPGYDNQPSFTPDGRAILFTSNRDGKQTDIYRYDIATKQTTQLTHTTESEYSPVVTPDGKTFSVIRVEADGTQRLWRFDLDGTHPRLVLTNVKGVGYHAWLDATHLAVFIVGASGQPNTLQLADTTTDSAELIDRDPGHGLALRPGPPGASRTVTYVCKTNPAQWMVKEFSVAQKTPTVLTAAVAGSEDLAWDPVYSAGRLFMPKGPKLFVWSPTSPWHEAGDFTTAGIDRITRLMVNPDTQMGAAHRLVFVAEPVSKSRMSSR